MSAYIPRMPSGEAASTLFSVLVDGQPLPLHTAYVSAMPYNRRWPGYQRPVSQREEACFGSFSMDAPVIVEVRPNRAFKNVAVRPLSLNIRPQVQDGIIRFTLPRPAYFTVELDGTHNALHLFAALYLFAFPNL